jgi:hypothetical protein
MTPVRVLQQFATADAVSAAGRLSGLERYSIEPGILPGTGAGGAVTLTTSDAAPPPGLSC